MERIQCPGALSLASVLLPGVLAGQESGSLITDRPDQTESTAAVPAGSVQVELGWAVVSEVSGGVETTGFSAPSALLRIGASDGVELRLELPAWRSEAETADGAGLNRDGLSDGGIGLKWELGSGPVQAALLGSLSVPVGDRRFSSERFDPSVLLLLSHDVTAGISLGTNLGLALTTEHVDRSGAAGGFRDRQMEAPYTFSIGFGLSERAGAFVESFGAIGVSDARRSTHSLDGGLTFLLSDAFQLDLSGGVGLNEAAEDWFFGTGVSFRLPG